MLNYWRSRLRPSRVRVAAGCLGAFGLALTLLYGLRFGLMYVAVTTPFGDIGSKIGHGVSRDGVLAVRPGMTKEQVVALLGQPICRRSEGSEGLLSGVSPGGGKELWVYGQPSPVVGGGFEIYVHMAGNRMMSIAVERFDLGVYYCGLDSCPVWYSPEQDLHDLGKYATRIRRPRAGSIAADPRATPGSTRTTVCDP